MQPIETTMQAMLDAYRAAVLARDVDAFTELYATNVRVFDLWGEWSYDGADAWRGMVLQWFGGLGGSRVLVDFDEVRTLVTTELAVVHAFVSYKGVSESGREEHAMRNRLTWILKPDKMIWKIIHEHTSAPADPATSKIILESPANEGKSHA